MERLSHSDYTVGWICPLEIEQTAALIMLEREHEQLPQPHSDHNVYTLGSIGGHNVVIVGLHAPGNAPAATAVAQMRMSFPCIRFGLLVGIGGGVPVKTENGIIRLGDVVVSKPAGEHSGAVQYDHGKAEAGEFRRTGILPPPPPVLLNAAQDLAAKRARLRHDPVQLNLSRIDTKAPGLRKYNHPGAAFDYLYPADYTHLQPGLSCDECRCDPAYRLPRELDDDDIDVSRIVVHRGTIASGELVIKNGQLRDGLAAQHSILCFETEAAGTMADFPCLVIRGISDYCDSHKNDKWHGFAAAAAAAYARQLFFHMPIEEVRRSAPPPVDLTAHRLLEHHDDQELQHVCDWITTLTFGAQQSDLISRRRQGTGEWLLTSAEYEDWEKLPKQTLFCPGLPGAGKTIMLSIVVDHLTQMMQNHAEIGVAYLYCTYQPQQQQRTEDLFLSLLRQLTLQQKPLSVDVKKSYERHKKNGTRPAVSEILRMLESAIQHFSRVYFLVDALDEFYVSDNREQDTFVSGLLNLQAKTSLNIFVTSRFIPEILSRFNASLRKEIFAHDDDVMSYVDGRIPELLRSKVGKYPEYPELRSMVRSAVVKATDGMFLLARLHMDALMIQPTLGHLKLALRELPKGLSGLDVTYKEAMRRIEGQEEGYRELTNRVLSWVTYAKRALSTTELQHAVAVRDGMKEMDHDFLPEIELLGSICAGLIIIDEQSDVVRLVHYTVKEYFDRVCQFPNAERDLASTCISYLSFRIFETGDCRSVKELSERTKQHPFYNYATRNWGHHLRATPSAFQSCIPEFLENQAIVTAIFQGLVDDDEFEVESSGSIKPEKGTAVHLAALFGLPQTTATLIEKGYPLDCTDSLGRTPLALAATNGYNHVVQILLGCDGVDPNASDRGGETALFSAAENGNDEMVNMLLSHNADPNVLNRWDETPLLCAMTYGHETTALLLLQWDVRPNFIDTSMRTPLSYAAELGYEKLVEALLSREEVYPSIPDSSGYTPLMYAAANGYETIVQLILEREAVAMTGDIMDIQQARQYAVHGGHERIAKLLALHEELYCEVESTGETSTSAIAENKRKREDDGDEEQSEEFEQQEDKRCQKNPNSDADEG